MTPQSWPSPVPQLEVEGLLAGHVLVVVEDDVVLGVLGVDPAGFEARLLGPQEATPLTRHPGHEDILKNVCQSLRS